MDEKNGEKDKIELPIPRIDFDNQELYLLRELLGDIIFSLYDNHTSFRIPGSVDELEKIFYKINMILENLNTLK